MNGEERHSAKTFKPSNPQLLNKNLLYIEQHDVENDLFSALQKKSLEEFQRLSGEVWTDFNPHDPGVTIADITNYALTELDYKLGFNLQDYLTDSQGKFSPEQYGLYFPKEVYPTMPVTLADYKKLLYARFPTLDNIRVMCDTKTGEYTIEVQQSPFDTTADVEKQIYQCFHAHRNLCENLRKVELKKAVNHLTLHTEMELKPGADATDVLAQVYYRILRYLSGSVVIKHLQSEDFDSISPEEWLEGTSDQIRVTIPQQEDTEHELYYILIQITEIKTLRTCYLVDEKEQIITDFKKGYNLVIPQHSKDFYVRMRIGQSEMAIDEKRFLENLQALYFSKVSAQVNQNCQGDKAGRDIFRTVPQSTYRNVFTHHTIAKDFPSYYITHESQLPLSASEEQRIQARQMSSYLHLFDSLIQRGLTELKGIGDLLSVQKTASAKAEVLTAAKKENDRYREVYETKNSYFDMLDNLYGVESNPAWMKEFYCYGEKEDDLLKRRMTFLQNIPTLTKNRSQASDISKTYLNMSGIKAYLSYLLGLNTDETFSAGNVLPAHNLILIEDLQEYDSLRQRLYYKLIDQYPMDTANISQIEMIEDTPETDRQWEKMTNKERNAQYEGLRQVLPVLNTNFISGGLFRNGVHLDNYKLVKLPHQEWLLSFWDNENKIWMSLGRMNDKEYLKQCAGILRNYFRELNQQSEVVYVLEHNLLAFKEYFKLSFVFPSWTARFKSARFRAICTQLIQERLPVHLKADIYWLDTMEMQYFEENYRKLFELLPDGDVKDVSTQLMAILSVARKREESK